MPGAYGLFSNVPNQRVSKFCSSACMKFYGQDSRVKTDVTRPEDGVPASNNKFHKLSLIWTCEESIMTNMHHRAKYHTR